MFIKLLVVLSVFGIGLGEALVMSSTPKLSTLTERVAGAVHTVYVGAVCILPISIVCRDS